MGKVGSFGDIQFYTKLGKTPKALSFHDLRESAGASWAKHERKGKKALLEFEGADNAEITLTIEANIRYGINPMKLRKSLFEKKNSGKAERLTIGGKSLGSHKWVITNISENFQTLHIDGRPTEISFDISLLEYPKVASKKKIKKTSKDKKKSSTKKVKNTAKKKSYEVYKIKKNDTLWGIAKKYYKDGSKYTKIYNANKHESKGFHKITNPNRIYEGWVIKIPLQ